MGLPSMEGAWAPWALVLATNAFFQSCWRLGDCRLLLLLLLLLSSAAAAVVFGAVGTAEAGVAFGPGLLSGPAAWPAACACGWPTARSYCLGLLPGPLAWVYDHELHGGLQVLALDAGAGQRLVDEVFGCAPST